MSYKDVVRITDYSFNYSCKSNCTPNQKLACFVLYLKIINTFLKNNRCISKSNCPMDSKMALKF